MFTRGQTQICNVTTLAPLSEAQKLDGLDEFETSKRWHASVQRVLLCLGLVRQNRPADRDAVRSAMVLWQNVPWFGTSDRGRVPVCNPYRIRDLRVQRFYFQASICASTMSHYCRCTDQKPVAGISCGLLVTGETDDDYLVLTDIQGLRRPSATWTLR